MEGRISISRPSGHNCNYIEIELIDRSSLIHFLRVKIEYANFAKVLTGQGELPCEFELRGLERVGKTQELKHERIFIPDSKALATTHQIIQEALAPFEIDEWAGRLSDALNPYNIVERKEDGAWYSISFIRYVDQKGAS